VRDGVEGVSRAFNSFKELGLATARERRNKWRTLKDLMMSS
jgi:hypothetical protein